MSAPGKFNGSRHVPVEGVPAGVDLDSFSHDDWGILISPEGRFFSLGGRGAEPFRPLLFSPESKPEQVGPFP